MPGVRLSALPIDGTSVASPGTNSAIIAGLLPGYYFDQIYLPSAPELLEEGEMEQVGRLI